MSILNRLLSFLAVACLATLLNGCGSVQHKIELGQGYAPKSGTTVQVGTVTNQSGQKFEVDAEKMLSEALVDKLSKEHLLSSGGSGPQLLINSKIVEYEPGNAFKRWLLPGWGSTILSVQSDLKESGNLVGSIDARRTVSIGGGYSIGAWRTIFGDLAGDIVDDLKSKIGNK